MTSAVPTSDVMTCQIRVPVLHSTSFCLSTAQPTCHFGPTGARTARCDPVEFDGCATRVGEREVVARARDRDVGLYLMSGYRHGRGDHNPALVLGYGHLTEDSIRDGIAAVADLLASPRR